MYDAYIGPFFGTKVKKSNSTGKVTLKVTMDYLLLFLNGKRRCVLLRVKSYYISYIISIGFGKHWCLPTHFNQMSMGTTYSISKNKKSLLI